MSIRDEILTRAIRKLTADGECVTPAHTCFSRGLQRRDPEMMCNYCYGTFALDWQPERPDPETFPSPRPSQKVGQAVGPAAGVEGGKP